MERLLKINYLLDKKNGKIQAVSNQTHKIKGVNYNNSVRNAFKNGNKNQYISIHNHPSWYPPSLSDIAALSQVSKNGTVAMGLTIGHDGSMYWYTASAKKFKKNDNLNYGIRLKKNLHISYNEVVVQEATLAEFVNKYGFKFGKIGD
ncbi:hypothetical protein DS834_03040 [Lactobacillus bombicola]|uniref:JAB domain-containing protein n=1 Tax=Lactobacillus bombicola TaxID=1505723 RepID=A0ABX9LVG7_9LACO|nr:hypothetical protein [Lactobacillus bombicola]RHW52875.1 hypothetical protein DS834_03040 [Lactobacillus bombicola]